MRMHISTIKYDILTIERFISLVFSTDVYRPFSSRVSSSGWSGRYMYSISTLAILQATFSGAFFRQQILCIYSNFIQAKSKCTNWQEAGLVQQMAWRWIWDKPSHIDHNYEAIRAEGSPLGTLYLALAHRYYIVWRRHETILRTLAAISFWSLLAHTEIRMWFPL